MFQGKIERENASTIRGKRAEKKSQDLGIKLNIFRSWGLLNE
jgi:hypothetical protein